MQAVEIRAVDCVKELLWRGGNALDLDHKKNYRRDQAIHIATRKGDVPCVRLLLTAGADPRSSNYLFSNYLNERRETPLALAARRAGRGLDPENVLVGLLEAAAAEPDRARCLVRSRSLIYNTRRLQTVDTVLEERGLAPDVVRRIVELYAPRSMMQRFAPGQELPRAELVEGQGSEELVACVKYVLGFEGGGGVHEGEGPAPQGMEQTVFVKLIEMLEPQ